jgi:hypothetical protein
MLGRLPKEEEKDSERCLRDVEGGSPVKLDLDAECFTRGLGVAVLVGGVVSFAGGVTAF